MFDDMMNRIYASYSVDILGSTEEKSAQVEQVSSSAQSLMEMANALNEAVS